MPHTTGMISFDLKRSGNDGIKGEIVFPEELTGKFIWDGKTLHLKGSPNIEF